MCFFSAACTQHVSPRRQFRADVLGSLCKFPEKRALKSHSSRTKCACCGLPTAEILILNKSQSLMICSQATLHTLLLESQCKAEIEAKLKPPLLLRSTSLVADAIYTSPLLHRVPDQPHQMSRCFIITTLPAILSHLASTQGNLT